MTSNRPIFWISCLLIFCVFANAEVYKDPNVVALSRMLSSMDESIKPCQDFQNYSAKFLKRGKSVSLIGEFQNILEDVKHQDFVKGSLEEKIQQFYNICLARERPEHRYPVEKMTLQELENQFGMNMSIYLTIHYDISVPPNTLVEIRDRNDLMRFKELLRTFDPDVEPHREIDKMFCFSLELPLIERVNQCVKSVCLYLNLATNLLYEERVLGTEKLTQYYTQIKPIFEAIRQQINIRLERNSMNYTTNEIRNLQDKLSNLTLSIGNIPEKVNHREFVTDFYKDLDFSEDNYESALFKASEFRRQKGVSQLQQSWNTVYKRGNIIVVPYNLMVHPSFELESHDIFRVIPLGFQMAFTMLDIYRPNICSRYNCSLMNMFDDYQKNTVNLYSSNLSESEKSLARQQIILMVFNLVHEAYFAPGSKFSQIQPSFTTKTLSQLSFLILSQISTNFELTTNLLPKLPSFPKAFNCTDFKQD